MDLRLAYWAMAGALIAFLCTLYSSFHNFIPYPVADEWQTVDYLRENNGHYPLPKLWAQHNEHRMPITKLLMVADMLWFRGRNVSVIVETYIVQFAHLLVLSFFLRRFSGWPRALILSCEALAAFSLFLPSQWEIFLWPLGIQSAMAYLFASSAICALLLARGPRPWLWTITAIAMALATECSLAIGLALWPLLIVAAFSLRLSRAQIATLTLSAAACIVLYLHGYFSPPGHAKPLESIQHPVLMWEYIRHYYRNPLVGIALVCLPVIYLRVIFFPPMNVFRIGLTTLSVFLLGNGIGTALGRLIFSPSQAESSRYQDAALLFWFSAIALFADYFGRQSKARIVWMNSLILAYMLYAVLTAVPRGLREGNIWARNVEDISLPVIAGVNDEPIVVKLSHPALWTFQDFAFLSPRRLAYFGDYRYEQIGRNLTGVFRLAPSDRCMGVTDGAKSVPNEHWPGWRLTGWAWDKTGQRAIREFVETAADGRIVGRGLGGELHELGGTLREDVSRTLPDVTAKDVGWIAYVPNRGPSGAVQIYGVVDDGRTACKVGSPYTLQQP